MSYKSEDKQ